MTKQRILVPLDGSQFSRQIVSAIKRLFRPEDVGLILFEAIEPPDMPSDALAIGGKVLVGITKGRMESPPLESSRRSDEYYRRTEALVHQHEQSLQDVVHTLTNAGFQATVEVEIGEPAPAIVARIRRGDIDVIAMATHGRSGISHLLMGSVAEEVLRTVSVPLLLMRPS